jgi:TPR repeat protein
LHCGPSEIGPFPSLGIVAGLSNWRQGQARPKSVKTSVAFARLRPVVLALACCLHAGFSVAQPRFDWSDITAFAWADASIVPPETRATNGPSNTPDAVRRIRNAAENGDALAQFRLGRAYEDGDGVPAAAGQAHLWYRKAADQRFPSAEFAVGMDYARGQGVELDIEEAVHWIRRAATQGHALAQYSLGMAYATGKGIERDGQASIPWFRRAADQGLAAAQFKFAVLSIAYSGLLGTGVGNGVGAAVEALRKSADQDFGPAQFALGLIYLQGSDNPLTDPDTNLVQDFVESYKWLTVCWKRTFGELQSSCERRRVDVERKMTPEAIGQGEDRALEWAEAFSRRRLAESDRADPSNR